MQEHVPVLANEVLRGLAVKPAGVYLDATFGRGGHSRMILAALGPAGRLLAMDRDPEAVQAARELAQTDARLTVEQDNFGQLRRIVEAQGVTVGLDGILFDLGVSSPQLDTPARGFSFQREGPLDMRMDPSTGETAADWLNRATEAEISHVLRSLGEEPAARRIARAICERRRQQPLGTTSDLADLVLSIVPRRGPRHPATRVFQAIRIVINRELEALESALSQALEVLREGGRLCVISFHSLEDRIAKRFLRDHSRVDPRLAALPVVPESARPRLKRVGGAIRAGAGEIAANPRARSAVLRVAEKLA